LHSVPLDDPRWTGTKNKGQYPTVRLRNLTFHYPGQRFGLRVPELAVEDGETLAIVGPSGCGKTTLLRLIAGILVPSSGEICIANKDITTLDERQRRDFRIRHIGMIFQDFELLDYLDARDNILLPYRVTSALTLDDHARGRVASLAEATGVTHLLEQRPTDLSQGERQRLALCRALVTEPILILADEPTGNLDPENQRRAVDLLCDTAKKRKATLIMVTHDPAVLDAFDRHIVLPELVEYTQPQTPPPSA
jgi:putative ABC transport system ATP-binding protein